MDNQASPPSGKRAASPSEAEPFSKRFQLLEERQQKAEFLLEQIFQNLSQKQDVHQCITLNSESYQSDSYVKLQISDTNSSPVCQVPQLSTNCTAVFSFAPTTREKEPLIPNPDPYIADQGISCQRIGSSAWNKVGYMNAQEALQVGGVFNHLQVNPELPAARSNSSSDSLARFDQSLGIITHGLLLQRQAFSETFSRIIKTHPPVTDELTLAFTSTESKFKIHTDNLLQYTCGKKAEAFKARRKLHEPENSRVNRELQEIPPSKKFLYDEVFLNKLVCQSPTLWSLKPSHDEMSSNLEQNSSYSLESYEAGNKKLDPPVNVQSFQGGRKDGATLSLDVQTIQKGVFKPATNALFDDHVAISNSNPGSKVQGGQLHLYVNEWMKRDALAPLLKVIQGYSIPFTQRPPLTILSEQQESRFCTPISSSMTIIIDEMLSNKVLVPLKTTSGFLSRMFLVPKNDSSLRPIFNLRRLNEYLTPKKFRLVSHFKVPLFLQENDFLIKIDLTQAYFHVPVKASHQRFLSLAYKGKCYSMTCLPFGLATAPQVFAFLSNWIAEVLRKSGIRVIVYLDDFLLAHQDPVVLEKQGKLAVSTLQSLGWTVNITKSQLTPVIALQFLGIMWDPHLNQKYLPLDKQHTLSKFLKNLLCKGMWSWQDAKSLLGYLSFASFVIRYGRLHCRRIQRKACWLPQKFPHRLFPLPSVVQKEILWWLGVTSEKSKIFPTPAKFFVTTDASDSGWGAQINNSTQSGVWTSIQLEWHINRKEMFAVHQAIKSNLNKLSGESVLVQSDNLTVVSYIQKQGGNKSLMLLNDVEKLLVLAQNHNIILNAQFIPSICNSIADNLSRQKRLPDWHLLPYCTNQIFHLWGVPQIDLFATEKSAVVRDYVTLDAKDQKAIFVDAFSKIWDFKLAWVFPPPALIPRVLQHLNSSKGTFIVIAPRWEKVFWRPDLKARALASPLVIQHLGIHLLDLATGRPPLKAKQLNLEAWKIQGGPQTSLHGFQQTNSCF